MLTRAWSHYQERIFQSTCRCRRLIATIDGLFKDKSGPSVTLSTIHRAKGLEADTVYWLNSEDCPPSWVKKDWQKQQEINLCYVATTRAKQRLILIQE